MRKYIFTERERRIIEAYLSGATTKGVDIARLRYNLKVFKRLGEDVELYLRFREAVSAKSA
jgi:hypothetical protein